MGRNVLVFAEIREGKLRQVTLEALSIARRIKEEGKLTVAVLGKVKSDDVFDQLAAYGADRIILISDSKLVQYNSDAYVAAWKRVIKLVSPEVVFAGHTTIGKEVSPRIAAHFDSGLVSDCTQITIQDGELIFTRPIYAGKAFESRKNKSGMVFATIRPNNFAIADADHSRKVTIEEISLDLGDQPLRTIVKEAVSKAEQGIDLSEAKIVIAGGRGLKSAEGFQPLQELADLLGAAVGASRGACDAGFCDYGLQIGQTGKVVTPDLYIACGISGAIQHVAGMSASKVIVAINKDPEAPIFQIADFGIVGDLFEVVPLLTDEFRQLLSKDD